MDNTLNIYLNDIINKKTTIVNRNPNIINIINTKTNNTQTHEQLINMVLYEHIKLLEEQLEQLEQLNIYNPH